MHAALVYVFDANGDGTITLEEFKNALHIPGIHTHMNMFIYIYIHIYTYIHTHIYTYICTHHLNMCSMRMAMAPSLLRSSKMLYMYQVYK